MMTSCVSDTQYEGCVLVSVEEVQEKNSHSGLVCHILNVCVELVAVWQAREPQEERTNSGRCLRLNAKAKARALLTIAAITKNRNRAMTSLKKKLMFWKSVTNVSMCIQDALRMEGYIVK